LRYRTITSDGDVSISDVYEARAKRVPDLRVVTVQHGVRLERGRLSGVWWQRDANGLVLPDTQVLTVFDRVLASVARKPDPRVRMLGITRKPPRRYVIEVAPNSRIVQRVYIDAATLLIDEVVTQDYDRAVTTTRFSNYVWIGGRPVPSRESQSNDLSNKTYVTTLLLHRHVPFDSALLAVPRSKMPFVTQASLPATVNSLFSRFGILVRADIQGTPYWLKLDSGATDVVLDRDLVRRLGLHEFGKYTAAKGGRVDAATAVLPRIDVGPVYATNLVVKTFSSDDMEDGVEVVGLLGCDFIASRPLAIDFHKQTVTEIAAAPPATGRDWTSLRTPLHACRPSIGARLAGRHATLLLDFGSPSTVINEDLLKSLGTMATALDTKTVRFIGGEPLLGTEYVVSRASAGGLDLAPLLVTVVTDGRAQDLDDDGFVGRNVLNNYRVVLDYLQQRTYFRKYAGADDAP
jgi:Aspartyl protease